MIGISKLHFEKSFPQVLLFLHVFNDDSAGLEKKLQKLTEQYFQVLVSNNGNLNLGIIQ